MTAYVVATLTVTDPDKMAAYRERAADALARHGGEVLAAAPAPHVLEGGPGPSAAAVIRFADAQNARAWISDPDLQGTHALRTAAGQSTLLLIG